MTRMGTDQVVIKRASEVHLRDSSKRRGNGKEVLPILQAEDDIWYSIRNNHILPLPIEK